MDANIYSPFRHLRDKLNLLLAKSNKSIGPNPITKIHAHIKCIFLCSFCSQKFYIRGNIISFWVSNWAVRDPPPTFLCILQALSKSLE